MEKNNLEALLPQIRELESMIHGVEIKPLVSHPDDRGFFREIIRHSDPLFTGGFFGQWSHSKMQFNVVKAWHYHHVQTDWWYVPLGVAETVLFDNREESPTYKNKLAFLMGESGTVLEKSQIRNAGIKSPLEVCVRIPPGVLHGCKVLTEFAHLFYITSHTYDPGEEGRHPYNSEIVSHDWGNDVIVVEKDKRSFVPVSTRSPIK